MDKLLSYGDSEDNSEDEECCDSLNTKESQPNYFGFNSANDSDTEKHSCPTQEKKRRLEADISVNVSGRDISLPSADFWKGITEDEISKPQEFSGHFLDPGVMTPSSIVQTDSCCSLPPVSPLPVKAQAVRTPLNDFDKTKPRFETLPVEVIKPYARASRAAVDIDERSRPQGVDSSKSTTPDPPRKIYFVHSKVSSHMSSVHKCQPMTKQETSITAHASAINRIQWSVPQFSHLLLSVSMDSLVKVWNVWSTLDPCVQVFRHHSRAVKDAEWDISGRRILTCGYDRKAVIADVETGCVLRNFDHSGLVSCARYHPVNPNLFVTSVPNRLYSWDTRIGQEPILEYSYKDKLGTIQDLLFSRDGDKIFSCCDIVNRDSADRNIMAWDYRTGVILSNQIYHEKYTCSRLRLHSTENYFLAQSLGGYIAIFSSSLPFKMDKSKRFEKHKILGYKIGFDVSPDGSLVTTGSADGMMYTYNFYNGKMVRSVQTGMDVALDVACHPVLLSTYACCSWDGRIQVWK